jgi:hypothetical protein
MTRAQLVAKVLIFHFSLSRLYPFFEQLSLSSSTQHSRLMQSLKHPTVEDYRQAVVELDEKEYIDLRLAWKDLRNNYAVLYDMILKNFEKIVRPRSSDKTASLY